LDSKAEMLDLDGIEPAPSKTKASPHKAPSKAPKGGSDSDFAPTNATPAPPEHK
jgi:hypothetical protein